MVHLPHHHQPCGWRTNGRGFDLQQRQMLCPAHGDAAPHVQFLEGTIISGRNNQNSPCEVSYARAAEGLWKLQWSFGAKPNHCTVTPQFCCIASQPVTNGIIGNCIYRSDFRVYIDIYIYITYVRMYVCTYGRTHACMDVCMDGRIVCMHGWMHGCMYACM